MDIRPRYFDFWPAKSADRHFRTTVSAPFEKQSVGDYLIRAGPKRAVDDSVLPFRPRSDGSARFAAFCSKFITVTKGTGSGGSLKLRDCQRNLAASATALVNNLEALPHNSFRVSSLTLNAQFKRRVVARNRRNERVRPAGRAHPTRPPSVFPQLRPRRSTSTAGSGQLNVPSRSPLPIRLSLVCSIASSACTRCAGSPRRRAENIGVGGFSWLLEVYGPSAACT